jgi:hypothetical protein
VGARDVSGLQQRRAAEASSPQAAEQIEIAMRFRTKQRLDFWLGGLLLLLLFVPIRLLGITLRRDHSTTRRRGCVVIKLVGAGSLFLAMPSLQAIRRQFPPGEFGLVGTREVVAFARSFGWFDHYHVIDDSSLTRVVGSTLSTLGTLARRYDHLIDLEVPRASRLCSVRSLRSVTGSGSWMRSFSGAGPFTHT